MPGPLRVEPGEPPRLSALARQAAGEVFSFDSRLWGSLRSLCLRPGELSRAWREGRDDNRFLAPLRLYLVVNLIFFLVIPVLDRWSGSVTIGGGFDTVIYLPRLAGLVERDVAASGLAREVYAAHFDAHVQVRKPALIAVVIPMLALVLTLALSIARPRRYVAEHVVVATHYLAWFLVLLLVLPVVLVVLRQLRLEQVSGIVGLVALGLAPALYGAVAARTYYGLSIAGAGAVGVLLAASLLAGLWLYGIALVLAALVAVG